MRALPLLAAALTAAVGLTVIAVEGLGLVPAVHAARWTARVMFPFIVAAFVVLGRSFRTSAPLRQALCRASALSHAVHLVAVAFVVALEPPEAREGLGLVTEVGGGSAAAVVVAGWWLSDRGWYRWITYFPWGVLAFTYIFLVRLGDTAPRIEAAPPSSGPCSRCWRRRCWSASGATSPESGPDGFWPQGCARRTSRSIKSPR